MALASGHTVKYLEEEERQQYILDFTGTCNDLVKLEPGGVFLPKKYLEIEKKIYNFKFRPEDVVVMVYPKCGTTWMQEIVWTMRNNPDLNHPDADDELIVRSPYLEMDMLFPSNHPVEQRLLDIFSKYVQVPDHENGIAFQLAECDRHSGGRTLKTHLPLSLLPKNLLDTCKLVYVARNPKDHMMSMQYHFKISLQFGFTGSQDTFLDYYVKNSLMCGSYPTQLREIWGHRGHPNLHMVFYEDLKADIAGQITKLDTFLGTNLTQQQMDNVIHKTSFNEMKKNLPRKIFSGHQLNKDLVVKDEHFFRKGQVGGWKGEYTPEQEAKMDDWIKESFEGLDVNFKYD